MRRVILLIVLLVVPAGVARSWTLLRQSWEYPNRFAEVIPGQLYRGGVPNADQVDRLSEDKNIKTIMCLTEETKRPEEKAAIAEMQRHHIQLIRVPMPGDGAGTFEAMDLAAETIADTKQWPMYFHCAAGKQRSNAATAAYLLKIQKMPLDAVLSELVEKYDLDPVKEKKLYDHIRSYSEHVESSKP
jgi:protein tyrosine/serine phosphatase